MVIYGIDPGTRETGWCAMSSEMEILAHGIDANHKVLEMIGNNAHNADRFSSEMFASMGMIVGREVFETLVWIGRFQQAWREPEKAILIYRHQVKMHLCNSSKAKDANIRQAIIDLYPATGGGTTPQIGTKAQPGPLYGVSSHVWPAIGVAIVAHHQSKTLNLPNTLPLYQTNGEEPAAPF